VGVFITRGGAERGQYKGGRLGRTEKPFTPRKNDTARSNGKKEGKKKKKATNMNGQRRSNGTVVLV